MTAVHQGFLSLTPGHCKVRAHHPSLSSEGQPHSALVPSPYAHLPAESWPCETERGLANSLTEHCRLLPVNLYA